MSRERRTERERQEGCKGQWARLWAPQRCAAGLILGLALAVSRACLPACRPGKPQRPSFQGPQSECSFCPQQERRTHCIQRENDATKKVFREEFREEQKQKQQEGAGNGMGEISRKAQQKKRV